MIAIYGASGFGREVAWLAEKCQGGLKATFFIDDDENRQGTTVNGIPVLSLMQAAELYPDAKVVVAIGNPIVRERLMKKAAGKGFGFETLVHSQVEMSKWVEVGIGTVICGGSILTTNIHIGEHVHINLNCTIGHDVVLGDFVTLAPGVHISGCVQCGRRVYIGTGAVIINGTQDKPIVIGDDVVVGAGACVTRSIPTGQAWGGVPAVPLRT